MLSIRPLSVDQIASYFLNGRSVTDRIQKLIARNGQRVYTQALYRSYVQCFDYIR